MNKKSPYLLIALFLLTAIFSGCKKYLSEVPDARVSPQSVEDYQAMVVNAYPEAYYLFTEFMTDNFRYYDYTSFNQPSLVSWIKPLYTWSDGYDQNLPIGPEKAWNSYYNKIYNANVVIEGLSKLPEESDLKRSVLGEAYLIRAYCHFMLVNIFAKHYDPATAAADPGVPYQLGTGDAQQENFPRQSVADVYSKIEADLLKGADMVNDKLVTEPGYHFQKASAYAFLSRVKLYEGDWAGCIDASNKALALNSSVRDLIADYNNYIPNKNEFYNFSLDYGSVTKSNNLLVAQSATYNGYASSGFYANEFKQLYLNQDYRGKIFVISSNTSPNWKMLKLSGQQSSNVVLFSVEEVLLNQAEAYVRSLKPDYNAAITDLNKILIKRYSPFTALTAAQFSATGTLSDLLLQRVYTERRLELAYEGYRWFDIKRLKLPVTHSTGSGTETLSSGDLRYAIQIPFRELTINKAIVPNPR
ncbi:RagB/SusD family nutrient uptake outer membrane protein [Pedobacter sp. HMF7647]|uniref:RagB/SusD family nutrient uptake outer membrane protein n=1 Tax=Hufsiella arboris TaxID=2695275 RepID=A0A7K1YCM7_9SPHI|nr:RagB/SusD family nutrient uptake outer membrane protein [Hufsiella arboris]MXV52342.1 RagB/SusD family nutrient uptake outer membrane protein [Hufsiella arboris]